MATRPDLRRRSRSSSGRPDSSGRRGGPASKKSRPPGRHVPTWTFRASLFSGPLAPPGAVAERLLHTPRKRASERTWGFESLPLRRVHRSPPGRMTWRALAFLVVGGRVRTPKGFDSTRSNVLGDQAVYRGEDRGSAGGGPEINPSRSVELLAAPQVVRPEGSIRFRVVVREG